MTQINTKYEEGSNKPVLLRQLSYGTYFRLNDNGQTVFRLIGYLDSQEVRVLNLDDLQLEAMNIDTSVRAIEVNSIEVKVELV